MVLAFSARYLSVSILTWKLLTTSKYLSHSALNSHLLQSVEEWSTYKPLCFLKTSYSTGTNNKSKQKLYLWLIQRTHVIYRVPEVTKCHGNNSLYASRHFYIVHQTNEKDPLCFMDLCLHVFRDTLIRQIF